MDKEFKTYIVKLFASSLLGIFIGLAAGAFCMANADDDPFKYSKNQFQIMCQIYDEAPTHQQAVVDMERFVTHLSKRSLVYLNQYAEDLRATCASVDHPQAKVLGDFAALVKKLTYREYIARN